MSPRPADPHGKRTQRKPRPPEQRQGRDQPASAFATILEALLARVGGARGAVLVDSDGETVDYAGALEPFELRLAAAHWRIALDEALARERVASLGSVRLIALRTSRCSYVVRALPDGYALVIVLTRSASLLGETRALEVCVRALCQEAAWPEPWGAPRGLAWFPVEIAPDARRRPGAVRVSGILRPLEILGAVVGPGTGEKAWRVRFETGAEAMLVRESGGHWYADEPPDPGEVRSGGDARAPREKARALSPLTAAGRGRAVAAMGGGAAAAPITAKKKPR